MGCLRPISSVLPPSQLCFCFCYMVDHAECREKESDGMRRFVFLSQSTVLHYPMMGGGKDWLSNIIKGEQNTTIKSGKIRLQGRRIRVLFLCPAASGQCPKWKWHLSQLKMCHTILHTHTHSLLQLTAPKKSASAPLPRTQLEFAVPNVNYTGRSRSWKSPTRYTSRC